MSDLKRHQQCVAILKGVAMDLESLSNAFYRTGNNQIGEELFVHATDVREAMKGFQEAYGGLQQQALDDARNNIGGLLSVAMKMDELNNKKPT
jgi:hypothetical protein